MLELYVFVSRATFYVGRCVFIAVEISNLQERKWSLNKPESSYSEEFIPCGLSRYTASRALSVS